MVLSSYLGVLRALDNQPSNVQLTVAHFFKHCFWDRINFYQAFCGFHHSTRVCAAHSGVYRPVPVLKQTQRCRGWGADQDFCHDSQNLHRGGSQRHFQSKNTTIAPINDTCSNIKRHIRFAGVTRLWGDKTARVPCVSSRSTGTSSIAWSSKTRPQGRVKVWVMWDTTNRPKLHKPSRTVTKVRLGEILGAWICWTAQPAMMEHGDDEDVVVSLQSHSGWTSHQGLLSRGLLGGGVQKWLHGRRWHHEPVHPPLRYATTAGPPLLFPVLSYRGQRLKMPKFFFVFNGNQRNTAQSNLSRL